MKSVYNFVVEPIGERYNNKKKIGNKELILNTEIYNHQFVNRLAKVISVPIIGDTNIQIDDEVIIHHNVFRRWHNQHGIEKNSRGYINENNYLVQPDQIFLYKRNEKWIVPKGYCFIQPIKETDQLSVETERQSTGIIKYSDGIVEVGDIVSYRPNTECEFIIDNQKLYRVLSNLITIKYEYQGNEEAYNPSWT